jgi:D-arginine dehydrogenase
MTVCDFLIIGGGIAGASLGAELSAHGNAIVLERESAPGYHSTGRSAALYMENRGSSIVRALVTASGSFFRNPPDGFSDHPLLLPRGMLIVAREDQLPLLAKHATAMAVPTSARLDAAGIRALLPVARDGYAVAAIHDPGACDLNTESTLRGYLRMLGRRGGRLICDAEVTAIARDGKSWRVNTRHDTFDAGVVVNASGAWADTLASLAGLPPLGLAPLRRTVALVPPPEGVAVEHWPLVIDAGEQFYFKPEGGRVAICPCDETPSLPCDAQADEMDVAIAADWLIQATTIDVRRIAHRWAGLRTFAPDRAPVVGIDPLAEGFFWYAGLGGYGIETCAALARLGASLLVSRTIPTDLAARGLTTEALEPARLRPG